MVVAAVVFEIVIVGWDWHSLNTVVVVVVVVVGIVAGWDAAVVAIDRSEFDCIFDCVVVAAK